MFNRGVDKRTVFQDKADYARFHLSLQLFNSRNQSGGIYELHWNPEWIKKQKPLVHIHAYCLLNNHFHLLATQVVNGGLSEFMKRLGGGYTSYFNERYDRSGALFQGNYKRVLCEDNEQLLYLAAYINLNNMVHAYTEYYISSFDTYLGKKDEKFVKTDLILDQYKPHNSFRVSAVALANEIARKRKIDKEYNKASFLE